MLCIILYIYIYIYYELLYAYYTILCIVCMV